MGKSKVYFTSKITSEQIVELYKHLGKDLPGKVCVKVHSGEQGNRNFLGPDLMKDMIQYVNGTVVECNTAYAGARNTTPKHIKLIREHGWDEYFDFDLLDAEGPDMVLPVDGKLIRKDLVGRNLANYDSMLVISHFKGHAMGGYGGALKQLSIGLASSAGKAYIHSAGKTVNQKTLWLPGNFVEKDKFMQSMADAATAVCNYFKGNMAFINIMKNISVDCDCDGNAKLPCMEDIGILASTDPVAVDRACLDLIENSKDPGRDTLLKRINSRHGMLTPQFASEHGIGNLEYELINI